MCGKLCSEFLSDLVEATQLKPQLHSTIFMAIKITSTHSKDIRRKNAVISQIFALLTIDYSLFVFVPYPFYAGYSMVYKFERRVITAFKKKEKNVSFRTPDLQSSTGEMIYQWKNSKMQCYKTRIQQNIITIK